MVAELPWTGERLVPQLQGNIALEHLHRYALAARLAVGRTVLDIACGEGYGSDLMARDALEVIGVDASTEVVRHAEAKYQRRNLWFCVGTCSRIPVPSGSVDLVVSFETLEHHDEHEKMLSEVRRVLRPDGVLLISTPDRRFYSDLPHYQNPYHKKELYLSDFERLLGDYFRHHTVFGQRVCTGSIVAPLDDQQDIKFASVRGNFASLEQDPGLGQATYLIGMAWNGDAPATIPLGLFEGKDLLSDPQLQLLSQQCELKELRQRVEIQEQFLEAYTSCVASLTANGAQPATSLRALQDLEWYSRLVRLVGHCVRESVPPHAVVVVLSKGDDRLLALGDRCGWHFPQNEDGTYAGHYPADGAEAVAHLEALRTRGGEYLLVPSSGFWWLDDYPEFGRHLRANYRLVCSDDDTCMIFALR